MTTKQYGILVVEDERHLLAAVAVKLERSGFGVLTAESVEQAKACLKDVGHVDAVWLDHYLLGKETGLDFVAYLKSDEATKHLPIFVVSNTTSPEKQQSYMRLGITKYYIKSNHRLDAIIEDIRSAVNEPHHER